MKNAISQGLGLFAYNTYGKAYPCMSFVLHFLPVQLSASHLILLTMQYDHSKHSLDYIFVIPDLKKWRWYALSNLQLSAGCLDPLFCYSRL